MRRARRNPTGDTINAALAIGGALALGGVVYAVAKPKTTTPTGYRPPPPMICPWGNPPSLAYQDSIIIAYGDFSGLSPSANSIAVFKALTPACFRALPAAQQQGVAQAASAYVIFATGAMVNGTTYDPQAFAAATNAASVSAAATPIVPGPPATGAPAPPVTTPAASVTLPNAAQVLGLSGRPRMNLTRFVRSRVTGLGV